MREPAELIAEAREADRKAKAHGQSLDWLTPVEEPELNNPETPDSSESELKSGGDPLDEPADTEVHAEPLSEPEPNELEASPVEDVPVVGQHQTPLEPEVDQDIRKVEEEDFTNREEDSPLATDDLVVADPSGSEDSVEELSDRSVSEDSMGEDASPVEIDVDSSVLETQSETSAEDSNPTLSSSEQEAMSAPEVHNTEMSDMPVTTLEAVTFEDSLDPSRELNDAADRQIEFAMKMNDDFAEQLGRELGPVFQELRDHQTQTTHDFVNSQLMMSTWLRDKG